MVTKHLNDEEIQLVALGKSIHNMNAAKHIHVCAECKNKLETYQLLIKGITRQPQPSFDFDLSGAVLNQIPTPASRVSSDKLLTWTFIYICAGFLGTALYLFRKQLDSMFIGIGSTALYLMVISAVTVVAILFIEMYKKYQKEMKVLDLY